MAYHSWVENPLQSTDFTSWPSGDCFLTYPGNRSSVRFERLRDGTEDFERIQVLQICAAGTIQNASPPAALARMEETLKIPIWERNQKSGLHTECVRLATDPINAEARSLTLSR